VANVQYIYMIGPSGALRTGEVWLCRTTLPSVVVYMTECGVWWPCGVHYQ